MSAKAAIKMQGKEERGWNLYLRADGQYVLQYRRAVGDWPEHRIPREHRTERAAERYARAWLQEYRKQLGDRPLVPVHVAADDSPTIRSLADDWLKLRDRDPKLSPAIREQNDSNMRSHVLAYPEIADAPIAELGSGALRTWLRKVRDHGRLRKRAAKEGEKTGRGGAWERTGEPLAPYTTRNVVNTLTAFFEDAMAEEWVDLPANPMRHPGVRKEVPAAETKAGRRTIIHFTRAVVERLLVAETTPEPRRVRYLLAATSGMRDGEIAGLRIDDVDVDAMTVSVTKALPSKGPEGFATMGPTKTENSVRTLPLHPLAAKALKAWKAAGWARHVGRQPSPTDALFPNADGEHHRPDSASFLRADLRKADLPDKYQGSHLFDFHAFRRSFYTWLGAEGVERDVRDMLMGHAGATVGDRHYGARDLERMRRAVESITLDLSNGEVVSLPIRIASGAAQTESDAAVLTAGRGKPAVRGGRIPNASQYARSDSNGRLPASKADALSS